jgi:hypothetical protein
MHPIVIELHPREEECAVCEAVIVGGRKGIAMNEGEPVPHDWAGEWGGFACCETCFAEYERVQGSESEREVWWATKRREARMRPIEPIYLGDL